MADHLARLRASNAAARKYIARARERLAGMPAPDDDEPDSGRITLTDLKDALDEVAEMRPKMESTGELVIDAGKKTATLRAPPWVIALGVAAVALVAWLALR